MDIGMEAGIFLAYAGGLMLVYFFGRFLLAPVKLIGKLLVSSLAGGLVLIVLNFIGSIAGISLPVNIITAAIAGLLGLPGIAGLIIYFNVF